MLRVGLVGELCVELDERKLEPIASRRARSVLAWLAYRPGLHPRSRVAAVFWPEVLDASARASLRTALATLRRELGEASAGHIVAERDRVGVVEGREVWVDLREAERLAAEGRLSEALELRDDARRFSQGKTYFNFPGLLEEGDSGVRETYGANYGRLARVKEEYDPENLFRLNQNIQPVRRGELR